MSFVPLLSPKSKSGTRSIIDNLSLLRAFVAVVESRSFSEAARRMRVVPSTISKHVSTLEARIRAQLIIRSTTNLSVTELGEHFYQRCVAILEQVEEAEYEVGSYNAEPQGILRISAATVFSLKHLGPIFARFLDKYPKVTIESNLSVATADMVGEGFDVAIRITSNLEPGLIAVKLAANSRIFCAAPSYLEKAGTPLTAADLEKHNCLIVRGMTQLSRWSIRNLHGEFESINVSGNFVSDNGDLVRQMLVAGLGIGHLARFMVQDHLDSGELVEIFPDSRVIASNIYAVYPERRNLPLKTRAFIDHLKSEFKTLPSWAR